ncbi:hypothetical protein UCRPC4_g03365 [Phaeomoniella chlamydospora]|uniref:Uncharacterized protein n=1 Tax=Phaeomoniella chlamydospora TaxID=158046 RepID=A0A0G2EH39_PHACM|nr:hypothetical protein UCRPC4_g03365 [Phaeomoniella chlamydospora]
MAPTSHKAKRCSDSISDQGNEEDYQIKRTKTSSSRAANSVVKVASRIDAGFYTDGELRNKRESPLLKLPNEIVLQILQHILVERTPIHPVLDLAETRLVTVSRDFRSKVSYIFFSRNVFTFFDYHTLCWRFQSRFRISVTELRYVKIVLGMEPFIRDSLPLSFGSAYAFHERTQKYEGVEDVEAEKIKEIKVNQCLREYYPHDIWGSRMAEALKGIRYVMKHLEYLEVHFQAREGLHIVEQIHGFSSYTSPLDRVYLRHIEYVKCTADADHWRGRGVFNRAGRRAEVIRGFIKKAEKFFEAKTNFNKFKLKPEPKATKGKKIHNDLWAWRGALYLDEGEVDRLIPGYYHYLDKTVHPPQSLEQFATPQL